ncbi:hypothetical protein M5W83_14100 [Paenibacillus thiaminolyticus]|uniref:Uncharacterized protein n=1 Tax=Paenibacillus thiaminolyticus TaxID=49283 RepID=A0AAP9DW99_PANTH|nr:hypothetical protein [Paenibacillus thiaminolyticus]MCY9534334.1 hypothetical protein [Paenibacillus thiaminolyticus]MCY9603045.1 hypothetical protein [Paenibacillus thiaminolyticus]MCY9608276.1 hypothetical protein [Paenibacillus thiaminolyticus]MCY9611644.1 hypothetical protein [Paenibacillus thiaminolyticus]MCY9618228.1 hypothetical protein [Paenibacillus thiaminolyticus]
MGMMFFSGISLIILLMMAFEWLRRKHTGKREQKAFLVLTAFAWGCGLTISFVSKQNLPRRITDWIYLPMLLWMKGEG